MSRLTRRQFLKLTGSAAAGVALLSAGCAPEPAIPTLAPSAAAPASPTTPANTAAASGASPTSLPSATALPPAATLPAATPLSGAQTAATVPAASALPTVTALPSSRADLMRIFPAVPSRVVRARHSGVWNDDNLSPEVLGQMLDAAITRLTGLPDANTAWQGLFDPGERIALKVNTAGSSVWTHVPLVTAITDRLQAIGVPPEQITVYDRSSRELRGAGFKTNRDGPGVRCYGTDDSYSGQATVTGQATRLSDILMQADALINVPLLKQHGLSGFTFALKNHYGTINNPLDFHYGQPFRRGLAEISTLPPIKDKTRLIIGDALTLVLGDNWDLLLPADSLFMSFDPVALDTTGVQVLSEAISGQGRDPRWNIKQAGYWLASGAELGLGTNDPANIESVEAKIA
jgi:uncharacterized protein (DUF362 family)